MEWDTGISRAGWFGTLDLQIDDDRVLTAADHDGFAGFIRAGVDFLMRNVGRYEDEIAGAGFVGEFETVAPPHAGAASYDVEDGFEFTVMVGSGFRIWLDDDSARPELSRSGASVSDGGGACHAGCLRSVGIEFTGADDSDSVVFPVLNFGVHGFSLGLGYSFDNGDAR
jgi:hypothetical protein